MVVKQYPFYIKATVILIGLFYLVNILSALSGILIPFAFAVLFSILLNPLYNRLLGFKMPKPLAVLLTLLAGLAFTALIIYRRINWNHIWHLKCNDPDTHLYLYAIAVQKSHS
jgi:predicted PurR-regulated permease PerM